MKIESTPVKDLGHQMKMSVEVEKPCGGAIDLCHGMLIFGALLSAKPVQILELGIGTGFITKLILDAIEFNRIGALTCVDNLFDMGGNLTEKILAESIRRGATTIHAEEKEFIHEASDKSYDFLVSDADHHRAGEWTDEIFRVMQPNAFMFFHDTSNPDYPGLRNYEIEAQRLHKPCFLFNQSSRADEDCGRGLLMVINTK